MKPASLIGIIGGGPTGALLASFINTLFPASSVFVIDKGRELGGRMSTNRASHAGFKGQADHGAVYITQLSPSCRPSIGELQRAGLLEPMKTAAVQNERKSLPNFVASKGIQTLPLHFLHASGASVLTSTKISSLEKGDKWRAKTEDGQTHEFDAVISTIPAPQLLQLVGDVPGILAATPGLVDALKSVRYSSRYALICYFDPVHRSSIDALLPYSGRYVQPDEDDVIRYISYDTRKREGDAAAPTAFPEGHDGHPAAELVSLVFHTSVSFGAEHLEADKEATGRIVLERVLRLLPGLPEPVRTKSHRWRYSQVTQTCPPLPSEAGARAAQVSSDNSSSPAGHDALGSYGVGALLACAQPPLILAGDSFSQSHFDGCVYSAQEAARLLLQQLHGGGNLKASGPGHA